MTRVDGSLQDPLIVRRRFFRSKVHFENFESWILSLFYPLPKSFSPRLSSWYLYNIFVRLFIGELIGTCGQAELWTLPSSQPLHSFTHQPRTLSSKVACENRILVRYCGDYLLPDMYYDNLAMIFSVQSDLFLWSSFSACKHIFLLSYPLKFFFRMNPAWLFTCGFGWQHASKSTVPNTLPHMRESALDASSSFSSGASYSSSTDESQEIENVCSNPPRYLSLSHILIPLDFFYIWKSKL